jgi:hypothetical protein
LAHDREDAPAETEAPDTDPEVEADEGEAPAPDGGPRRPPTWMRIGVAALIGVVAAFASRGKPARVDAPAGPARREARREPGADWPRPLPREPGQWLRDAATECGVKVTGLRTEAHATTFPSPSGAGVVLWEVSMKVGAEGAIDDLRNLMERLSDAPCGAHVPELTITWERGNRVRAQMHAVLLGTWPNRPATTASRRGNRT